MFLHVRVRITKRLWYRLSWGRRSLGVERTDGIDSLIRDRHTGPSIPDLILDFLRSISAQTHVDVVAASTGRNEINTTSFSTSFTTLQQLGLQDHLAGSQEFQSAVYISVSEVTLIWLTLINCSKTVQFFSQRALTWFFFFSGVAGTSVPPDELGTALRFWMNWCGLISYDRWHLMWEEELFNFVSKPRLSLKAMGKD